MGKYKIKYDKGKCIAAGSCAQIAPDTWKLDEEGKADPLITEFDESVLDINVKAAKSCPVQAIEIYDEAGKKVA